MTGSLLVEGLVNRLKAAEYQPLSTPFKVASVDFEFTAALRGTAGRGLDLVLIVDTATGDHGDRDAANAPRPSTASHRMKSVGSPWIRSSSNSEYLFHSASRIWA